ncbi:MAG: glycosyltransferase family 2 protein [candidate division Zixibacteria bacterium]|nr:glycosyltransferase family 2 protein [candidate division Zixibacteria bacterium]
MSAPELSVVIPFFNEEACCEDVLYNLAAVLDREKIDYELIPVDNGSLDRTGDLLDRLAQSHDRIRVVTLPANEGYGWGILSGFRHSTGVYTGYMDGDAQVSPESLIRIYTELKSSGADLCKATRITRMDGLRRVTISRMYNMLFRGLFLCRVKDVNAKPKIMRRVCIDHLNLVSKDWFIDAEIVLKAHNAKMRIHEVAIEFLPRNKGKSKVKLTTVWEFINNLLRYYFSSAKKTVAFSESRQESLHV